MYGIVDCNSFYASCERAFRPDLRGKPIVVLSNNDGCIIARSAEAKKFDIPMAKPYFKVKHLLKENNIHVFSSNYPLYGDMSSRVMQIIEEETDEAEVYSIDEAFFKIKGLSTEKQYAFLLNLRKKILKQTGLPVSIGLASTKALSKIANKIAKKFEVKTGGVHIISDEELRLKALNWTKIQDVWGIGRRMSKRLHMMNVFTAFDYTQLSDETVRKQFAVTGLRLKKDLEGEENLFLGDSEGIYKKKLIATTRSFESQLRDLNMILERMATFANSSAEKLRAQKGECQCVYIFLRGDKFGKQNYKRSAVIHFPYATNSSITITKEVVNKTKEIYREGDVYKKAGVVLMGILPENIHQLNMFDYENPKHKQLMQAVDHLNDKINYGKVKLANQDVKRTWKMRQNALSPKYTTDINEVIRVNCNG